RSAQGDRRHSSTRPVRVLNESSSPIPLSKIAMPNTDPPAQLRPSTSLLPRVPHVVVVGCGFGGLSVVRALRGAPVRTTLFARTTHHRSQPLIYQVATAELSSAQIAAPVRELLSSQQNVEVLLGEVVGVDKTKRVVFASNRDREHVPLAYDFLVLATGA